MSDTDGGASLVPGHICRVHIIKIRPLPLTMTNPF
jgi:hypothetical protein